MSGKVYEHLTAYRHVDGKVEGFKGVGSSKLAARNDALLQIYAKIDILAGGNLDGVFDKESVVTVLSSLTREEMDAVQKDWRSGIRY